MRRIHLVVLYLILLTSMVTACQNGKNISAQSNVDADVSIEERDQKDGDVFTKYNIQQGTKGVLSAIWLRPQYR